MFWQGLQRDVQYSVSAAEMVICSGCWKESPVEKEQAGDVPSPWEGGTGTLAGWGITSLHECAPSQTSCPIELWLFQLHEKDNTGKKEVSSPCHARGKPKRNKILQPAKKALGSIGIVRQARSTRITEEQLSDRTTLGL